MGQLAQAMKRIMPQRQALKQQLAAAVNQLHDATPTTSSISPDSSQGYNTVEEIMAALQANLVREHRVRILMACSLKLMVDDDQVATASLLCWWVAFNR